MNVVQLAGRARGVRRNVERALERIAVPAVWEAAVLIGHTKSGLPVWGIEGGGSKSDYLENAVLDLIFGASALSAPANLFFALFTVTPTDVAASGTEVTGGSYARKSMTNNATNFPAASAGSKSNGVAVTFVQATADWGTVVAFAVFDAASSGNMLYWGAISPTRAVLNGDTASFAIGALTFTED